MVPSASRLVVVVALLVLGVAAPRAAGGSQAHSWWKSEDFRATLGLTVDQSARIDAIFTATLPELRQDMNRLDELEARLSQLIESDAEETDIARQIDRVETARAQVNKTRSLMLVRMRRVLTPEQRARMKALEEEMRRRGTDTHRRPGSGSDDSGS
jgi:Spy/CpxP family protein refolding chaperone